MKTCIFSVMASLALAGCGGGSAGGDPLATTAEASGSRTVCSIDNLPDGWVVVAHDMSPLCPAGGFSADSWNAYTIQQAGGTMTVCDDSPIPAGYVKGNPVQWIPCVIPMWTANYTNAFVIEKL